MENYFKKAIPDESVSCTKEKTYFHMARTLKDVIPEKLTRPSDQSDDDDADEEHPAASWPSESDTEAPKKAGKAELPGLQK